MNTCLCLLVSLSLAKSPSPGPAGAPDWVNGPSHKYSRELYLVGVGMADDRQTAHDRARGEISRIFQTLVSVQTSVSETEQNIKNQGKEKNSFSQSVANNVQTASQKMLEGVEIAETWRDRDSARTYALAILERAKAQVSIKEKIADLDLQASNWKEDLARATDRLPRVKAAMKLMALLKARELLNSELRVLDPQGRGITSPFNEAMLRPEASKALSSLEVHVLVAGEGGKAIETGLIKGLNSLGLQASTSSGESRSDILAEAQVFTSPLEPDQTRWRWARSSVTVSLKDGRNGKTFLRFDDSERQAALDQGEATRRSNSKLSQKLAGKIHAAIQEYFENQ